MANINPIIPGAAVGVGVYLWQKNALYAALAAGAGYLGYKLITKQ